MSGHSPCYLSEPRSLRLENADDVLVIFPPFIYGLWLQKQELLIIKMGELWKKHEEEDKIILKSCL